MKRKSNIKLAILNFINILFIVSAIIDLSRLHYYFEGYN